MANQNLSQFGEKLFVSDADHTFIWDSAVSISKRVSRNSWLNSGTLTSDAPVTISQTWNAVGQTFTAFKVNAAGTSDANSASGSLLLDLQLGGVSKFKVGKDGYPVAADGSYNVPAYRFSGGGSTNGISLYTNSIYVNAGGSPQLSVHSSFVRIGPTLHFSVGDASNSHDITLTRDGAGQLALRNGAAAQTFNVYGTWTTAITNFERLAIKYNTTDVAYQIAAEKGTTNGDYRPLQLWTGGASRLHITTAGNVGIGTTAPGSALHISGALGTNTTTFDSAAALKLTNTSGNTSWLLTSGVIGVVNASFSIRQEGSTLSSLVISNTGNVGFGTNSPAARLHIFSANQTLTGNFTDSTAASKHLISAYTNDVAGIDRGGSLGLGGYYETGNAYATFGAIAGRKELASNNNTQGYLSFLTNAAATGLVERMRIDSVGNVGIGTTSPTSKLQVTNGDVEIETVTSGIIMKAAGTSTRYRITLNATGDALVFTAI